MMKGRWAPACQRGRVCTFYLRTSLKGDSLGLAWKTTAVQGTGEWAMGVCNACVSACMGLNPYVLALIFACMHQSMQPHSFWGGFCMCCVSVHTLPLCASVSKLLIKHWPLTLLTLLVRDERHLFFWLGLSGMRYSLSVTPHGLRISIDSRMKLFFFWVLISSGYSAKAKVWQGHGKACELLFPSNRRQRQTLCNITTLFFFSIFDKQSK